MMSILCSCLRTGNVLKNFPHLSLRTSSLTCLQSLDSRRLLNTRSVRRFYSLCKQQKKLLNYFGCHVTHDVNFSDKCGNSSPNDVSDQANISKSKQSKTQDEDVVDKVMSQYNIEEFYGLEAVIEPEEAPPKEDLVPISLERGKTGVYDIEELVTVLQDEKLTDVCVIEVPASMNYVDHMVIATGKSARQLLGIAQHIRWIWKRKRNDGDPVTVFIEGKDSKDWIAVDMGNIALHLFLKETREMYNLEVLWSCGSEYDELSQVSHVNKYAQSFIPSADIYSKDLSLEEAKRWYAEQTNNSDVNQIDDHSGERNRGDDAKQTGLGHYVSATSAEIEVNEDEQKLLRKVGYKEGHSMENTSGYHDTKR